MSVKSLEETTRNYVEDSIRKAYFEGSKNANWVMGIIRSSGVRGDKLLEILNRLKQLYPDKSKELDVIFRRCKLEGYF